MRDSNRVSRFDKRDKAKGHTRGIVILLMSIYKAVQIRDRAVRHRNSSQQAIPPSRFVELDSLLDKCEKSALRSRKRENDELWMTDGNNCRINLARRAFGIPNREIVSLDRIEYPNEPIGSS